MKSIIQILAVLPLLATSALAQSPTVNCRTVLGTKSVARVPTGTATTTAANRPTYTVVVQSTVTTRVGWASTSTRTKTQTETTTDEAVTDVFESTTTVYDVTTITDEATVTSTSTSTSTTSTTSTTIVATTAGFKNIRDTINSQGLGRRAINHPHAAPEKRALASGAKGVIAQSYPASVTCTKTTTLSPKTVYTTLRPATKTVAYWLLTTITYETLTSTSTVVPDHVTSTHVDTSVSSVQTTTTIFTTQIETSTTTTTSSLPGPTLFDACKPENIFGANFRHSGNPFYASNVVNNGPGVASDFKIMADGAGSAVECCAACQNLKTCETYIFRAQNRNCFLLSHDGATCSSQANHPNYFLSAKGDNTGAGYVVGNGNCGYTYSGNSDGSVYTVDGY